MNVLQKSVCFTNTCYSFLAEISVFFFPVLACLRFPGKKNRHVTRWNARWARESWNLAFNLRSAAWPEKKADASWESGGHQGSLIKWDEAHHCPLMIPFKRPPYFMLGGARTTLEDKDIESSWIFCWDQTASLKQISIRKIHFVFCQQEVFYRWHGLFRVFMMFSDFHVLPLHLFVVVWGVEKPQVTLQMFFRCISFRPWFCSSDRRCTKYYQILTCRQLGCVESKGWFWILVVNRESFCVQAFLEESRVWSCKKKNGDVEEGDFRSFCTQREVSETHHLDPCMFDNY